MNKLHCYASGDGALHFTWTDKKTGCASGKKVTGAQATKFLARKDETHLRLSGWFPMPEHGTGPYWVLVKWIERTAPDTVRMLMWDGEDRGADKINSLHSFTYEHDSTDWAYVRDGNVRSTALKVTSPCEEMPGGIIEVQNWSILHSLAYFLTHEKAITEWVATHPQPPLESLLATRADSFIGAGI